MALPPTPPLPIKRTDLDNQQDGDQKYDKLNGGLHGTHRGNVALGGGREDASLTRVSSFLDMVVEDD